MSSLSILEKCLDAVKDASKHGFSVNEFESDLLQISGELSEALRKLDKYYYSKLKNLVAKHSTTYNISNVFSSSLKNQKSSPSEKAKIYKELVGVCTKIEEKFMKSKQAFEQNFDNFTTNIDDINLMLSELSVMSNKAKNVKQRTALTVSQASRTLSDLKESLMKAEEISQTLIKDCAPKHTKDEVTNIKSARQSVKIDESPKIIGKQEYAESTAIFESSPTVKPSLALSPKVSFATTSKETAGDESQLKFEVSQIQPEKSTISAIKFDSNAVINEKGPVKAEQPTEKPKSESSLPSTTNSAFNFGSTLKSLDKGKANDEKSDTKPAVVSFSLKPTEKSKETQKESNEKHDADSKPPGLFSLTKNLESKPSSSLFGKKDVEIKPSTQIFDNKEPETKPPGLFGQNNIDNKQDDLSKKYNKQKENNVQQSIFTPLPTGAQSKPVETKATSSGDMSIKQKVDMIVKNYKNNKEFFRKMYNKSMEYSKNAANEKNIKNINKMINLSINTLSRNSGLEMIKRIKFFVDLLNGQEVETSQGKFRFGKCAEEKMFVMHAVFKAIHGQVDTIIANSKPTAFPIGLLLSSLYKMVPEFKVNFISFFGFKYPFIGCELPPCNSLNKIKELTGPYYQELAKMDGKNLAQQLSRTYESANCLLVISLTLDLPPSLVAMDAIDEIDAHSKLWQIFIFAVKSLSANPDLGSTIVESVLAYAGEKLSKAYKNQFQKVICILLESINSKEIDNAVSNNGQVCIMKIKDICSKFNEQKAFDIPEGSFPADYWKS